MLIDRGLVPPLLDLIKLPGGSGMDSNAFQQFDDRVVIKALEALKNILETGDVIAVQIPVTNSVTAATNELEQVLLHQFNTLNIQTAKAVGTERPEKHNWHQNDSAYSSLTDLFPSKSASNPFATLLLHNQTSDGSSGLERLRALVDSVKLADGGPCQGPVSRDIRSIAKDILDRWFTQ
jgi:hypothetical protein